MIKINEPLKPHTTFNIGGSADVLFIPQNLIELKEMLRLFRKLEWHITILGNGSNVLITDKGIRGVVIKICDTFEDVRIEGTNIKAGAGILIKDLINIAVNYNLKGLECVAGIPGTLGGCIYMNASYTKEIRHLVKWVKVIDYSGNDYKILNSDIKWGYRQSMFCCKKFIITEVCLQLEHGDCTELLKQYKEKRKRTQPIQYPSAGSVFLKNNLKDFQGFKIGDAEVIKSFIVNKGNASSEDVIGLINQIRDKSNPRPALEIEVLGER